MDLAIRSVVLASSSPYRRQMLQQIGVSATCMAPDIDESPQPNEPPEELALRLSEAKAHHILKQAPDALIIAGDQTASLEGKLLRKPGSLANATRQLSACSGRTATFFSAITVCSASDTLSAVIPTRVSFRQLSATTISNYLNKEKPFDCVGSFKCEGLGIALFESIESADPTALIGLPLISLTTLLSRHGYNVIC